MEISKKKLTDDQSCEFNVHNVNGVILFLNVIWCINCILTHAKHLSREHPNLFANLRKFN